MLGWSEEATITTLAATTTTVAETTTTVAETTTTVAATTTTTIAPVIIRQPLTGEPLASEAGIVARPALAVKIDNHPGARRNHSGLAVADIVYEEKVEGSLTRFAAVFHSQDADPVGPIRPAVNKTWHCSVRSTSRCWDGAAAILASRG